jgi:hypothetical protein
VADDEILERLEEIQDTFSEYQYRREQRSEINRVENFQLLIALGIVGGGITLYVQNSQPNGLLSLPYYIVILSSGAYIGLKTLVTPFAREMNSQKLSDFDKKWLQNLYAVSILFAVIPGSIYIVAKTLILPALNRIRLEPQINLKFANESVQIGVQSFAVLLSLLASFLTFLYYSNKKYEVQKRRERIEDLSDLALNNLHGKKLEEYLYHNPKIIDEKIEEVALPKKSGIDFMATIDGEPFAVEIKTHRVPRHGIESFVGRIKTSDEVEGGIVVAPDFTMPARKAAENSNIIRLSDLDNKDLEEIISALKDSD